MKCSEYIRTHCITTWPIEMYVFAIAMVAHDSFLISFSVTHYPSSCDEAGAQVELASSLSDVESEKMARRACPDGTGVSCVSVNKEGEGFQQNRLVHEVEEGVCV